MAFCVFGYEKVVKQWSKMAKKQTEYFGTFLVISVITETSRNKPSFGTDTDTENVPEYTGKNVPVFPVHFPKIIPNSETVTKTHGLNENEVYFLIKIEFWKTKETNYIYELLFC